jgi:hypothetical protein
MNTLEINFDLEAIEQGQRDLGFWHLQNASDFMRNDHALANLERLRIRDSAFANAVKGYIDGAELIFFQLKSIIDQQKKVIPKYYQNSY